MWSVAWGHRDKTEEEVLVEVPEKESNSNGDNKDPNGENKENQDGETAPNPETEG